MSNEIKNHNFNDGIKVDNQDKLYTQEEKEKVIKKYVKMDNMPQFSGKPGGHGPSGPGMKMGPGRKGGMGGGPRGKGMMAEGKPKKTKESIARIFSYMKADTFKFVIALICVVINNVTSIAGTYMLRPIINTIADPNISAKVRREQLLQSIIMVAAISIVGIIANYFQQRIMINISQRAVSGIRTQLYKKLSRLPVRYHDANTTGDLMSRFTNDVDTVGEMLNNTLIQLVSGVVTIVSTFAIMLYTSVTLTVVLLITIPLLTFAGSKIASKSRKFYKGQQATLGAVNGYIEEMVGGQKVVKVFCHEDRAVKEFTILSDELRRNQVNAQFFGGIMGPVLGNLSQVTFAIIGTVGGVLCLTTGFDIGGLTVFANYSRNFSRPINELSMQVNVIFSALAGAERVFDVIDEEPEKDNEESIYTICDENEYEAMLKGSSEEELKNKGIIKVSGHVELNDVTFGYVEDKTILKKINVIAHPGQKVAFVGSTGAGKTTITNLINRFYDIEEGTILLDGIEIKKIKLDSLRKHIAMVLQDTHLFTGTIMENIRYGRLDATDEEVIEAAKLASAHSFIKRLEHGYDTMIDGDGSNLSQGQRQLLNIARAAISKAPILILDEATSSVDTRTEKHIEHGMERLMKNRTTFVIAHRLSTVRDADRIIVLEQGEIVEEGTHEELLEMKGRYYQLYTGAIELD